MRQTKITNTPLAWCLVMAIALFMTTTSAADKSAPPNIVLLIGDDHGAPYFGFMGDEHVVTPNMDMLAQGGVTFTQGHATANHCRPSLRTLMTGLHPIQYKQKENALLAEQQASDPEYASLSTKQKRMWTEVQKAATMLEFDTLPKLLADRGYASWQGGKWWENSYKNGYFTEGMTKGWDMTLFGQDDFFHEMMGGEGNELGRTTMAPLFDFIERRKDQPFFVWYGPMLPHTPLDSAYKHRKFYDDKALSESAKMYYGNISWWDEGVGQLVDFIQQQGLLENTLFVYINDNGWEQEPQVEYKKPGVTYENDLYFANGGNKGKLGLYDQSFRTPVIFYWKDRLQGSFNTTSLVSMEDIVPTILDIAGAPVPEGLPGYSLKPLLQGQTMDERDALVGYAHQRRSETNMMGQAAEGYYVRTQRWHFMWYKDTDTMALYDMTVDSKAEHNLIDKFPHLVEGFKQQITAWKAKIGMEKPIPVS